MATDGTISTVAGLFDPLGPLPYNGDNIPATKAYLSSPMDVISDSAGNLYISDFGNNRVRKVATSGIISTFAGNPAATSLGDNGSALQARLNGPRGLAFDQSGNLYIVDYGNSRIRRVSTDGAITTFAGGGPRQITTAPMPATQAMLGAPLGIVIDRAGNVYFSDAVANRVYEVLATTGNISIVAGNGNIGFSGDGGPALQAALDHPYGLALDASGNLLIADISNNRIREILVAPPALQSSPATLSFSAKSAGGVTDAQSIGINSTVPGLLYTLAAKTTSGGNWLKAGVSSGTIPASVQIQADPTGLDPGPYQGSIVISAPNANPANRTVTVSFTVAPPDVSQLGVGAASLTFSLVQGASPSSQSLAILNQGGGSLAFSASATTDTGGNWLSVSPSSGNATPVLPGSVAVQADPTGLDVGTYTGTVTIAAGAAGTTPVPVTMTVSGITRKLLLSQTGLKFNAVFQGGAPLAQSFAVLNAGQGDLNWTVQATTLTGGDGWLTVTPASGTSTAGASLPPLVNGAIDASTLTPGEYYGQIQVFSPDADNSPQTVSVVLDVLSTGTDPGPEVRPTGLVFTGAAGSSPGSQNVFISNLTGTTTSYASGQVTQDGQNWFVNAPTNATVPPNQPVRVVVQPDFTSLAPGTYNGVLTLLFNGGVVRTVNILSVVTGSSSAHGSEYLPLAANGAPAASGCSPKGLKVQFTSPDPSSNPKSTQPVSVQVTAVDDCGSPMASSGTMSLSFSNGDPSLNMVPTGAGVWTSTWQPQSASQVTLQATAFEVVNGGLIPGQATVSVTVQPGGANPVVSSSVQNSASLVSEPLVAPGGLISLFGKGLADGTSSTPNAPYDTQLGGTQVFFDNTPLALIYASDGQINAQAPYTLSANTGHQLRVVRNGGVPSIPVDVNVASAQPGIFTVSENGVGQGLIYLIGPDGSTNDTPAGPSAPVKAGDPVVILCTGLGLVAPSVNVGAPAPSSPAPQTVSSVLVSIGGKPAQVLFATLLPNNAGVYQVKVAVPDGVTGDQLPVILTVANQNSPATATMAVH